VIFSSDDAVVALTSFLLIHLALLSPLAGLTFTLDGILIGAGDLAFLAWAMSGAAALFIPLALLVPALGFGIGWVWGAIWVLMLARGGALWFRFRSDAWLVTGASL
jgi:Na+-driven multidrug efflux pump